MLDSYYPTNTSDLPAHSNTSSRADCTKSWKGHIRADDSAVAGCYCYCCEKSVRERHGGWAAAQEAVLRDHEAQGVVPEDLSAPFIPGGGANHADSRTHALSAKVSDRAVKAPSFSGRKGNYPEVHPIDYRGCRRKPFSEIEREINAIKRQMEAYRASCIKKKPNVEKEKLQQVFQYSPGSILPRELLPGSDLLDRELSHTNALRMGRKPKDRLEQLENMYDLVLDEVEQRKSFMSEMIALGKPEKAAPVEHEILDRMSELRRIHQLILREKNNNSADEQQRYQ